MSTPIFQPFEDRLSRDIRNSLSRAFARTLEESKSGIIDKAAEVYLSTNLAPCYVSYIKNRIIKYDQAIDIVQKGSKDHYWRGLILWDMELFFEVHEVLEHAWYTAQGANKRVLQAMIRAAGVYIKLEFAYIPQAKKMAAKALSVIKADRKVLEPYCNPDLLITALTTLNPTPPKLLPQK